MAKPDNPAEAPVDARPPRPMQRARLDASAGAQRYIEPAHATLAGDELAADAPAVDEPAVGEPARNGRLSHDRRAMNAMVDEAFNSTHDTTRNLEAPEMLADDDLSDENLSDENLGDINSSDSDDPGQVDVEEVSVEEEFLDEGEEHGAAVARDGSAHPSGEPRPGLAWVRPGSASASRTPKVPLASLERPSTSRVELTPSPVPRVALAPATGAVDISLVPGPHSVGSRNLPTLAAQHLIGRRQRRPAPAVPAPPPAAASREPRVAFALARDVRSSKGEIVLGLTIGLGVSLLLAGLGQAYLRGDQSPEEMVAEEQGVPAQLESVTLSARPEAAASARASSAESAPSEASASAARSAAARAPSPERRGSGSSDPRGTPSTARTGDALAQRGSASSKFGAAAHGGDAALLAHAAEPMGSELAPLRRGPARAAPPRATPLRAAPPRAASARAVRGSRSEQVPSDAPRISAADPLSPTTPPSASAGPLERAAAPSAPMTPAQSAGLGLDLPL